MLHVEYNIIRNSPGFTGVVTSVGMVPGSFFCLSKSAQDIHLYLFLLILSWKQIGNRINNTKNLTLYLICNIWLFQFNSKKKDMMSKLWANEDTISDLAENIVGKEEIACYEQFLFFPTIFSKAVCC